MVVSSCKEMNTKGHKNGTRMDAKRRFGLTKTTQTWQICQKRMGEQRFVFCRGRDQFYSPIPCEGGPDFLKKNEKPKTRFRAQNDTRLDVGCMSYA